MAGREEGLQALAMGGYGGYVWAAFGFTLISMIALLWHSWRAQQRRADELATLRSAVRGGRPGQLDAQAATTGRRLVAAKPGAVVSTNRTTADGNSPTPRLATPRTSGGT
jgi:heme exporter protein CcmD